MNGSIASMRTLRESRGGQYLSRLGLQILTIQLLGRWGSWAILRYIQEAPLEALPDDVRRAAQSHSLADLSDEFKKLQVQTNRAEILTEKLVGTMKADRVVVEENINERIALEKQNTAAAQPSGFVKNLDSGCVHRILNFIGKPKPTWRAYCPWYFGRANYTILDSDFVDEDSTLCSRCNRRFAKLQAEVVPLRSLGVPSASEDDEDEPASAPP